MHFMPQNVLDYNYWSLENQIETHTSLDHIFLYRKCKISCCVFRHLTLLRFYLYLLLTVAIVCAYNVSMVTDSLRKWL